jgi:innexin
MYQLFRFIHDFLKIKGILIDNVAFRLHYQLTFSILLVCSMLITMKQFVGDPIHCFFDGLPATFANNFCWIQTTFSIPRRPTDPDFPYPGIYPISPDLSKDDIVHHNYYQWVCFVLFFQAVTFYIPRKLWKTAEGGLLKDFVNLIDPPKDVSAFKHVDQLAERLIAHRARLTVLYFKYLVCECLNLANAIGQFFFIHRFLGGGFLTYGIEFLSRSAVESEYRPDPMTTIFPTLTKCSFHKYGPSGTIETKDGICVLPLNIVNEKIYIFLWFWLIILATVTGVLLSFNLVVMVKKSFANRKNKALTLGVMFYLELINKNMPIGTAPLLEELIILHKPSQTKRVFSLKSNKN